MNRKIATDNKNYESKNLLRSLEFAQYFIENSRCADDEAEELRAKLKLNAQHLRR